MANPLATILSAAMMLRYSLGEATAADRVEAAVNAVLEQGIRTADIMPARGRGVCARQVRKKWPPRSSRRYTDFPASVEVP